MHHNFLHVSQVKDVRFWGDEQNECLKYIFICIRPAVSYCLSEIIDSC